MFYKLNLIELLLALRNMNRKQMAYLLSQQKVDIELRQLILECFNENGELKRQNGRIYGNLRRRRKPVTA